MVAIILFANVGTRMPLYKKGPEYQNQEFSFNLDVINAGKAEETPIPSGLFWHFSTTASPISIIQYISYINIKLIPCKSLIV